MSPRFLTGVVLKRRSHRETDRFLTIYTKELGKVELLAKGARKATSKLAGSLEPMTVVRAGMVRGRSFDRLTSARAVRTFLNLKASLPATLTAGVLLQATDLVTVREHVDPQLFPRLTESLAALDGGAAPLAVASRALLGVLSAVGLRPDFVRCERCKRTLRATETVRLDVVTGGCCCSREHAPFASLVVPPAKRQTLLDLLADAAVDDAAARSVFPLTVRLFESLAERPLTATRLLHIARHSATDDGVVD